MTFPQTAAHHLERLMALTTDAMGLAGMTMAVTDRQELLWAAARGVSDLSSQTPATTETRFEIGSLGKPFTVIPLLQLYEAGLLDLHAPVSRYLPWFHIDGDFPEVTVHHLLNHTSGLPRGSDIAPHGLYESWALGDFRPAAPPGEYFCYSNVGYKTLGFLLERVSGMSLSTVIRKRMLEPLGMVDTLPSVTIADRGRTATGYASIFDDRPEHRSHPLVPAIWAAYATGDGAQVSTVGDMAAYLRLLLNRGWCPSGRVISEDSFGLMTENGVWTGGDYYSYGLATYAVAGRRYIGHGGGNAGFRSAMVVDMEAGLGIVLMTNRMGETDPLVEVAQHALTAVCAAQVGGALPPLPIPEDPTHAPDSGDYAGTYRSETGSLTLVANGDRLLLVHGGETVTLERRSRDSFLATHPDFDLALLEFGRKDGRVVEAFHGGDWYAGEGYSGPRRFDHPPGWEAFVGHYRARNPELSNFRVALRKGELTLLNPWGDTAPLVPRSDGIFRIGRDERGPERMVFSAMVDGQALRADYTGCPYYRTFEK